MKVFFESEYLASLYESDPNHLAGKQKIPGAVVKQYQKKVNILISIAELNELKSFRSLNFEALKGDRKGKYSIRLNKQYRLLFKINRNGELEIIIIEISKHYE
ncbi:MAG: type II toxin-antitoxin system RelE/ParE family toxin [Cyclobacteriaceae bacterium]|nr:type II toxin-antitoxin system RelE/ParE family toxin [Cyclobacteriaceae bacterium]